MRKAIGQEQSCAAFHGARRGSHHHALLLLLLTAMSLTMPFSR